MSHRRVAALALITCCACLEPPELDELPPIPVDPSGLDSWGPLDGPPPTAPSDESGAPPGPSTSDTGGEAPAPDPRLAQLRLTEVLVDPDGKDGGADSPEFVEIKNTGSEPVNLGGLRIDASSWPILDGAELGLELVDLEPGAYLVIQRWVTSVDPSLADLREIDASIFLGFLDGGGLRNADGYVSLGSSLEEIDGFVYGDPLESEPIDWAGPPVDSPGSGRSLCRLDESVDHDDSSDWSACKPTPGAATSSEESSGPTPIAEGALSIVEVHANPPGISSEEKSYEFIEIINISDLELELSGCTVSDALDQQSPGLDPLLHGSGDGGCASPTCLAPGARALVVGQGYLGPTGSALVLTTDDSTIADGGLTNSEPVVLWDATGSKISSYRDWVDPAGPPLPSDELPLHRVDAAAADEAINWMSAPPSPGE